MNYDYAHLMDEPTARFLRNEAQIIGPWDRHGDDDLVRKAWVGSRFVEIKSRLPHGQFEKWLKAEIAFDTRTARHYMAYHRIMTEAERRHGEAGRRAILLLGDAASYKLASPRHRDLREKVISWVVAGEFRDRQQITQVRRTISCLRKSEYALIQEPEDLFGHHTEDDFESMLRVVCHRLRNHKDPAVVTVLDRARDLLRRKGTQSVLRKDNA